MVEEEPFEPFFPPELASLPWALLFVVIWYAILRIMQRRAIYIRL